MYLFHDDVFGSNVRALKGAFAENDIDLDVAYSFKTNRDENVIAAALGAGCLAEVVSEAEYREASRLFDQRDIVYNGVGCPLSKYEAARNGAVVNVDSIHEYEVLSDAARRDNAHIDVGVRVSLDVGNGVASRFGVDVESGDFHALMRMLVDDQHTTFSGLHCHVASCRNLSLWREKARKMARIAARYGAEYVDLGGGMYGPMNPGLAAQFGKTPSFEDYARVVADELGGLNARIVVEPGTALVANAVDLLANVVDVKRNHGRWFVVLDCKDFDVFTFTQSGKEAPFHIVGLSDRRTVVDDARIVGCTCVENDVLCESYTGPIGIGDMVVFNNVGAYTWSMSNDFISARPFVKSTCTR